MSERPPRSSDSPHLAPRNARARRGASLVELLIALALFALAMVAGAKSLQQAVSSTADKTSLHVAALTTVDQSSSGGAALVPSPTPEPEAPKKEESRWSKAWSFAKNAGEFAIDNFTPVGDIKTLADPNASLFDKVLAGTSLAASVIPVPGVGPGVKALTKGVKAGAKGVKDTKRAKRGAEVVEDTGDAPDLAAGGKRRKNDEPEEECQGDSCKAGPGKNCFAAGTLVYTEDGDRPIESIAQGDRVWSRDPVTGELALQRIVQTFVHDSHVIDLVLADTTRSEHVTVTSNHPFWVEGAGFLPAGTLDGVTQLWAPTGALTAHAAASWGERTKVYNLEVERSHTYFVGALHAWVHNQSEKTCDEEFPEPAVPAADVTWKGFRKGELAEHFEKHGPEFGDITQTQYLRKAKEFAAEQGKFRETSVGNVVVKYDEATRRVLIGNTGQRELRTFYIADSRSSTPFEDAVELAKTMVNGAPPAVPRPRPRP